MTSPVERKSLKVSVPVHRTIHEMATMADTNADEVLRNLLSGIHVHLSKNQRSRWTAQADAEGLLLADWIKLRVEAAGQYDANAGTLHAVLEQLQAITRHLGIPVPSTGAREHQG